MGIWYRTCWVCDGEKGWHDPWDTEWLGPWVECMRCKGTGRIGLLSHLRELYVTWRYA